jgi:hypothetical protein
MTASGRRALPRLAACVARLARRLIEMRQADEAILCRLFRIS